MIRKNPKEKFKEVVDILDLKSTKNAEAIKRAARNNQTISAFSKHLPKK